MSKLILLILAVLPALCLSQVDNTKGGATAVRKLSLPPSATAAEYDPTNVIMNLSSTTSTRVGSGVSAPVGFRRSILGGLDGFTGDCPPGMTQTECSSYQSNLNSRRSNTGPSFYGREFPNPYNRGPITKLDWDFAVASPINNCVSGSVPPGSVGSGGNVILKNRDCDSWVFTGSGGPFWTETRVRPASPLPACFDPSNGEFSYEDQFDVNARGHKALNKITLTGGGLPDRDYYYSCLQETVQEFLAPIERTAYENLYHVFYARDLMQYILPGTVGFTTDIFTANYLCGRFFSDYPSLKSLYPGFISAVANPTRHKSNSTIDVKECTVDSTFTTSKFFTSVSSDGSSLVSRKDRAVRCQTITDLVCDIRRSGYLNGSSASRP